ncbi:MAG: putative ABC transporter permease [Clostridia bacterium]|nr:putative ABC transporter permease [Clostridia bacterium]
MKYNLETYFLLFMIYAILGWCMESVKMIFNKNVGKFVDRGFLIGPYLPIYGFGVVAIEILLGKYSNDIPALFWLSMITCGILEYFTSYVMEKLFNARWWDYSSRKFNINGRICLETLLPFGIAGVITVSFTNPFFISLIEKIPSLILHIISIFLLVCISIDFIVSSVIVANLKTTEADLSAEDDTEAISQYVRDKAEDMAMQLESDIKRNQRKRKLRRQRNILHLKLRVNKRLTQDYKETIKRTNEFKDKLSAELNARKEQNKLSRAELTAKLKSKFAEKSFLHRRLMNAFPNFEVTEKWKNKYNNRNKK